MFKGVPQPPPSTRTTTTKKQKKKERKKQICIYIYMYMVGSVNRGAPILTPKYYSPSPQVLGDPNIG